MEWLFSRVSSFNLVKNGILQVLNVITIVFNLTVLFFIDNISPTVMHIFNVLTIILATSLVIIGYMALNRYAKKTNEISDIAQKVAQGELIHRISHIDTTEEIGKLAWSINNMLDQVEAFCRDLDRSLGLISKGKTYRKMDPNGLHGDFIKYSKNINEALNKIATAQSKDAFIQDILKVVKEYQNNNYTHSIDTTGMQKDIIGLAQGINELGDTLSTLSLENLRNGLALQEGANILARNVSILDSASQEQSASLEETAAALEEITANMGHSNENTVVMSQHAKDMESFSTEGQQLAKQTAQSMDEINEQVISINQAITVIDQIAFQTNILSLNAAVEAATAGEAGKGFAVVAGEVRTLASRSSEAANEIKVLVSTAAIQAKEGKTIANDMITGYNQLSDSIHQTIELIDSVSIASREQETGIVQINDAVALLEKKTQESAKIASETNVVAIQSNDIAQNIVKDAKSKQIKGNDKVKTRKKLVNLNYTGPERRKVEKRIKTEGVAI